MQVYFGRSNNDSVVVVVVVAAAVKRSSGFGELSEVEGISAEEDV